MMFSVMILSMLLACIAGVHSYAIPLQKRVVYSPAILSPNASTIWTTGQTQTVTWNTSDVPQDITNPTGKIVLGYLEEGDDALHLNLDEPLADGFNITAGQVDIVVPDVDPDTNYIIVLFGDSGNKSPEFTINSASGSSSSGSATSTEPTSSTTPSPSSSSDASTAAESSSSSPTASASGENSTAPESDNGGDTDGAASALLTGASLYHALGLATLLAFLL